MICRSELTAYHSIEGELGVRAHGFTGNSVRGFQRHHLIPVNVVQRRVFEPLFLLVSNVGFDARNFVSNGVLLPASEEAVQQTGLPLHRGPHPQYDQLVSEGLAEISSELDRKADVSPVAAYRRISELQGLLRRALRHNESLMLNRNDPRAAVSPLFKLDFDIMQLSVEDLLA